MLGILKGLKVTLGHVLRPKITQIYPYVKPELPERSRGLIQLIREKETGVLKCEACLLCEKACPPRAITITYEERGGFRRRPLFRPKTYGGFYRARTALTAPYPSKIVPSAVDVATGDTSTDLGKIDQLIARRMADGSDALNVLKEVQDAFGYVSQAVAKRVSEATGVDMSELYSTLTLSPAFRLKPTGSSVKAMQDGGTKPLPPGDGHG